MASTRLKIFESADAKDNNDEMLRDFMKFTSSSQEPEEKKEKSSNRLQDRRATMAVLKDAHNKTRTNGEFINLEKQFKVKFAGRIKFISYNFINDFDLDASNDDKLMKKLSMRRDTMAVIQTRRDSMIAQDRRRSSVAFSRGTSFSASSGRGSLFPSYDNGYDNNGYEDDFSPSPRGRSRNVAWVQDNEDETGSQESSL